mmetsp:Transcript_24738/g.44586  ORF Transcript_24738/g.44586 Transcript_24738/m.44586 type:complete len:262 (-) Transcript_24738:974-1759(-)
MTNGCLGRSKKGPSRSEHVMSSSAKTSRQRLRHCTTYDSADSRSTTPSALHDVFICFWIAFSGFSLSASSSSFTSPPFLFTSPPFLFASPPLSAPSASFSEPSSSLSHPLPSLKETLRFMAASKRTRRRSRVRSWMARQRRREGEEEEEEVGSEAETARENMVQSDCRTSHSTWSLCIRRFISLSPFAERSRFWDCSSKDGGWRSFASFRRFAISSSKIWYRRFRSSNTASICCFKLRRKLVFLPSDDKPKLDSTKSDPDL